MNRSSLLNPLLMLHLPFPRRLHPPSAKKPVVSWILGSLILDNNSESTFHIEHPVSSDDSGLSRFERIWKPCSFIQESSIEYRETSIEYKMTLEEVYTLMDTRKIPGTPQELNILCTRIRELIKMNGKEWVKENRGKLLQEWVQTLCYLNSVSS